MPVSYRDIALVEAFKTLWIDTGCTTVIPNGITWGEAPTDTAKPYAVFDILANTPAGLSNRSAYREVFMQVKVYDVAPDAAGNLLDQVAVKIEDGELAMGAGQGVVYKLARGDVNYRKEEEGVWAAWCEFVAGRQVARTIPT